MITTLNLTAEVSPEREVRITLPDNILPGLVDLVVVVEQRGRAVERNLQDLLQSEFFGMWKDRSDIDDSVSFARQLRNEAWSRAG